MTFTTWKIQFADPLGAYVDEMRICLEIDNLYDKDPLILNHPDSLLEALEDISETMSDSYPLAAIPNTLEFISKDTECDLDPIWSGDWSELSASTELYSDEEELLESE